MCTVLPRKEYDAEFKTRVVTACQQAGASIAGIALANGINANLVHRWIRERQSGVVWADRAGQKYVLHTDEFKRAVVAQCREAGASITSVAYSHGLRPTLVHRWIEAVKRKQAIPAVSGPPSDDWLPVVVSEGSAPRETEADLESGSSLACPVEAGAIDIEFAGTRIRVPVQGENLFSTLRVILESLK
jgi:transposase-like protein